MQARTHVLGQQHVAGDDRLLGHSGPARQADLGGDDALVHLRALGEARLLRVLGHYAVERLDVLQRATHEDRVVHALAVVGEDADAGGGVRHGAELGELLAAQAHGHRADGVHVDPAGLLAEPVDLLDDARGVLRRRRVGHGVHGGEPARRGGAGAGEHRLGVLPAGLAQVGVQVDEPGQEHVPLRPDLMGALGHLDRAGGPDRGDHSVRQDDVDRFRAVGKHPTQHVGRG